MNKKALDEIFDTVGCKNVSKTDLSKDALVITNELKRVLDSAGYTPGVYPETTVIQLEIFETGETYSISYYASQREGSGRTEEYRAGLGELKYALKEGERIAIGCIGNKVYLVRMTGEDYKLIETVEKDIEGFEAENATEGAQKQQLVNVYERNPALRLRAISIHGTKCKACGFDFHELYGERGKGYIEVHHLVPLSTYGKSVKIDPVGDMTVLCSNCHRMVHRRKDAPLSMKELIKLIAG